MGRWEDEYGDTFGKFPKKKRNWIRIGKFAILGGFIILGSLLSVFIPRAGLSIEVIERGGIVGSGECQS